MAEILQARRNNPPAGFDSALRVVRRFAHSRGLVVGGPARLIGAERTGYGDSDEMEEGPVSYKLISADLLFDGLWIGKNDKVRAALADIADVLLEMSDIDIKDSFAPEGARLPSLPDERGRWYLRNNRGHPIGLVVRTGEGSSKRYLLHLWDGLWYLARGAPPFDLPVFGLKDLLADRSRPVMIHEGPKAWEGACAAADGRVSTARLANWMSLYCHIGWHGSDAGIQWTDWSVLKGRRVLIWSDMDETGVATAITLGRRLARMGGIVEYVQWGQSDIEANESWDWADQMNGAVERLTRYDIRERTRLIECPFDVEGNVHPSWAERSFLDRGRAEVYQASTRYEPLPLTALNTEFGAGAARKIMDSAILPYMGRTFRPGLSFGLLPDGRVNTCPPNPREPIMGAPLDSDFIRKVWRYWLKKMIPDVRQRKHLLRKAAWAIARPHKVSQHMVILRGNSGIGKSVFLDILCAVAGKDRAGAVYPDSIFKNFNDSVRDKALVCIHEIHSDDITRKQNASRLKELVGNAHLTIRQKYRDDESRENVIHWFGATNEAVPFAMDAGNDRFYFADCAAPRDKADKKARDKFFEKWIPRLSSPLVHDELYSAAKWLVGTFDKAQRLRMTGRAQRQASWGVVEGVSRDPAIQFALDQLGDLYAQLGDGVVTFFADDLINLVQRRWPNRNAAAIRLALNQAGYTAAKDARGEPHRKPNPKKRQVIWCREGDAEVLVGVTPSQIDVSSFYDPRPVDKDQAD